MCIRDRDTAGQLTVPSGSDSTNEDGKGTVGWEDEDGDRHTLTVKVEDYETCLLYTSSPRRQSKALVIRLGMSRR